MLNSRIYSY